MATYSGPVGGGAPDPDGVRELLARNDALPYGRARTVQAEELVDLAVRTGDAGTHIAALLELIRAYESGGERQKLLVPFARVLRMWDDRASDFDEEAAFWLHWQFKWASSDMIADPRVPLATIEEWLGEMKTRYQLAGYGVRAVHQAEFTIAEHVGDLGRARTAFDRWLLADRGEMSDCEACECRQQGGWRADTGDDAGALDLWAPVLAGESTCESEPHDVLSRSLLPLLRLGRLDQARANHLRGYRMARGVANLREAVGRHIEFCALSGNEARGLEILAVHASWFDVEAVANDQLGFLRGCGVLLRRLRRLGHDDRAAFRLAGRMWTVAELSTRVEDDLTGLVALFDRRNGTDAVGRRVRADLGRAPLCGSLPLGLRTTPVAVASAAAPATGVGQAGIRDQPERAGTATEAADLPALLARARELSSLAHPGAEAAWRRVATADGQPDPATEAELIDHRGRSAGSGDPQEARRLLLDAAGRFDRLGMPVRAICARARAALALTITAADDAGRVESGAAVAAITALAASGAAEPGDVMTVRLCRATALLAIADRLVTADDPPQAASGPNAGGVADSVADLAVEVTAELAVVVELARTHGDTPRLVRARIVAARCAVLTGEPDQAEPLLREAIDAAGRAEMPWLAGEPSVLLARIHLALGDAVRAEKTVRAALGTDVLDPRLGGHLRLVLAQALAGQDRDEDAAASALEAAYQFDALGLTGPASLARILLAEAYCGQRRLGEAAAILEETLPDVAAHHGQAETVRVRRILAACLGDLGEHRAAAEQLLLAAEVAQGWPDQNAHAVLATDAARSLAAAGMTAEATQGFDRAARLWRQLGAVGPCVRTLRATAWHVFRREDDLDRALDLMERASGELATVDTMVDAAVDTDGFDRDFEVAETFDQTARLLADAAWDHTADTTDGTSGTGAAGRDHLAGRALGYALRAERGFERCGDERWNDLIAARYLAAQIEADLLGRPAEARRRLDGVIAACERHGGADDEQWVARCRSSLEEVGER
ncbi:MAG TPA: hypothetical protein VFX70_05795 [Mycobacteriales bacterium]|nr:hypothetical protein [Mycobacteriales bacterium]